MKTAPHLDDELGEALQAYADRIPAVPNTARLLAALDAAPPPAAHRAPRTRTLTAGAAAGLVLLFGGGALAWSLGGTDAGEDPIVKVTEVSPVTTAPAPTSAPTLAPTTVAPTTLPPTTLPPTTLPPATVPPAAPVQAAPPVQAPPAAAPQQAATPAPKQRAAPTSAAPQVRPPATPTPPAQPPAQPSAGAVAFSASAAFGSCADDPPYDVYSGTAAPGSTISISSAFGGGSATADQSGNWQRKVVFQGAPLNETFSVTVSSSQGSLTFDFTHTG